MPTYVLTHVTDEKLLADLASFVSADRQTTAMILAHIAEVDARELFLPAACTSMLVYCTRVLLLSDDAAFKRIRAARAGRRFPVLFDAVADGRLHLTAVGLLAPHLTAQNVEELVAAASHKTKLEIEMFLARLAPRPDVPASIVPIIPPAEPSCSDQLVPEPVAAAPAAEPRPRVAPLAPDRFAMHLTISGTTHEKLERARALLRHSNPSGDLAVVFDRALDALIAKLEKEQFGATSRPRARKARRDTDDPSCIPADVRRAVYERDGGRCTFVNESGERCGERGFLQFDHRKPVCRGGQPTVENLHLLCGPHNRYEAKRALGVEVVRAGRARNAAVKRGPGAARAEAARAEAARDEAARAEAAREVSADLALALRRLGFRADEVRRAIANTTSRGAGDAHAVSGEPVTFDARLRAALAQLTRTRPFRASEGGWFA